MPRSRWTPAIRHMPLFLIYNIIYCFAPADALPGGPAELLLLPFEHNYRPREEAVK